MCKKARVFSILIEEEKDGTGKEMLTEGKECEEVVEEQLVNRREHEVIVSLNALLGRGDQTMKIKGMI